MDPTMEEFFRSMGHAFAANRGGLPAFGVGVALLALMALLLWLLAAVRRRAARLASVERLATHHGLGPEDVRLVRSLAAHAEATPLALLTHLDLFERATAHVLSRGPEAAAAVRRLRHALRFDRLPAHAPLLTTRELPPGTAVDLAGRPGQVSGVDELSLTVEVPGAPEVRAGERVTLELAHAREARYLLRCPLREVRPRPAEGLVELVLGHDELPVRVQRRAYARAPAEGPLELRPLAALVSHDGLAPAWALMLEDLSAGGALVTGPRPLPVGLLGLATFRAAAHEFTGLRAVVLSTEGRPGGRWRMHLEFARIPEAERERLVTAVAELQRADGAASAEDASSAEWPPGPAAPRR